MLTARWSLCICRDEGLFVVLLGLLYSSYQSCTYMYPGFFFCGYLIPWLYPPSTTNIQTFSPAHIETSRSSYLAEAIPLLLLLSTYSTRTHPITLTNGQKKCLLGSVTTSRQRPTALLQRKPPSTNAYSTRGRCYRHSGFQAIFTNYRGTIRRRLQQTLHRVLAEDPRWITPLHTQRSATEDSRRNC